MTDDPTIAAVIEEMRSLLDRDRFVAQEAAFRELQAQAASQGKDAGVARFRLGLLVRAWTGASAQRAPLTGPLR